MVYISSMEMYGTFNNSDTEITEDKIGYINPLKVVIILKVSGYAKICVLHI